MPEKPLPVSSLSNSFLLKVFFSFRVMMRIDLFSCSVGQTFVFEILWTNVSFFFLFDFVCVSLHEAEFFKEKFLSEGLGKVLVFTQNFAHP